MSSENYWISFLYFQVRNVHKGIRKDDSKDIINSGIKIEPNEISEEPHGIGKKYAEKIGTFSGNFGKTKNFVKSDF